MELFKQRLEKDELALLDDVLNTQVDSVRVVDGRWDGAFFSGKAVLIEFDGECLAFSAFAATTPGEGLSSVRVLVGEAEDEAQGTEAFAELKGRELISVDILEETKTGKGRSEALMYDTTLIFRFASGSPFALSTYNQLPDQVEAVIDPEEISEFENEYIMRWQVE